MSFVMNYKGHYQTGSSFGLWIRHNLFNLYSITFLYNKKFTCTFPLIHIQSSRLIMFVRLVLFNVYTSWGKVPAVVIKLDDETMITFAFLVTNIVHNQYASTLSER